MSSTSNQEENNEMSQWFLMLGMETQSWTDDFPFPGKEELIMERMSLTTLLLINCIKQYSIMQKIIQDKIERAEGIPDEFINLMEKEKRLTKLRAEKDKIQKTLEKYLDYLKNERATSSFYMLTYHMKQKMLETFQENPKLSSDEKEKIREQTDKDLDDFAKKLGFHPKEDEEEEEEEE